MLVEKIKDVLSGWGEVIALGLFMVGFIATRTPQLGPDSLSYLTFDPMRPPLYPLFVWLFHNLGQYQLNAVIWVQTIISALALLYARIWLRDKLNIPRLLIFFILLLTIVLILFHYKTVESIYSEGLAMPLFIVTFFQLIDCFQRFSLKRILLLMVCINLLILTRAQFYYLYSLLIVLGAWYVWKKIPMRQLVSCFSIMLTTILATFFINHCYHYLKHGYFTDVPIIGEQLIVQPLYLSDASDAQYFNDPTERNLFLGIVKDIEAQHLTVNSAPPVMLPPTFQIKNAYFTVAYNPILTVVDAHLKNIPLNQKDALLIHMSSVLYLHMLKANLSFYTWKVGSFFGADIAFFLVLLLVIGSFVFYIVKFAIREPNMNQIFLAVSFITILANTSFVALFEPILPSYAFYVYFLSFCLGGLLMENLFRQNINSALPQ